MTNKQLKNYIEERITIDKNGCWIWKNKPHKFGYSYGSINKKSWRIHRLSYIVFKAKIPKNKVIDHLCRVRNCVNPEHLEAVSQKENLNRGNSKGKRKTCKNGHKFTKESTYFYKKGRYNCKYCRICRNIPLKNI